MRSIENADKMRMPRKWGVMRMPRKRTLERFEN
jgi:hypothetical protein